MHHKSTHLWSLIAQNRDSKNPDKMIQDRIVFGTDSPKVREQLISKGSSLTLNNAVEIAWSFKTSQAQLSAMAVWPAAAQRSSTTVPSLYLLSATIRKKNDPGKRQVVHDQSLVYHQVLPKRPDLERSEDIFWYMRVGARGGGGVGGSTVDWYP